MTLQFSPARAVIKQSILLLLCLSISAGSADADVLKFLPAVFASRPHWRTSQIIETNNISDAYAPQVAIAPSGNAIAVWRQRDGSYTDRIWANRSANGSWGASQIIDDANAGNAENPQVAVDGLGNAIAVWNQFDGSQWKVWTARYNAARNTWKTAESIEEDAYLPQITIDGLGNAIVVYEHWPSGMPNNIKAARYDAASNTWQKEQISIAGAGADTFLPQIAVNSNGDAIAVWQQSDGNSISSNIWANRYAGGSWGTAQAIGNNGGAGAPEVAVDFNGNAIAVWQQSAGSSTSNIWANRYDINQGWATAQAIGNADAEPPQVTVDFNGNAFVVWQGNNGTDILSNRYDINAGWGTVQLVGNYGSAAQHPQVACCDAAGHAFAIWQQSAGAYWNVMATRYVGSGWIMTAKVINNAGSAYNPQIAVNASGKAVAVWEQFDGIRTNIWAARLTSEAAHAGQPSPLHPP